MPESSFRIVDSGVAQLFSVRGDVGRYMRSVGRRITILSKRYVGKRSHRLEQSINYRMLSLAGGVAVEVTASNHIALLHHQGTRPHIITPRRTRVLRFNQRGRVVYAQSVLHPGTRPNRYLVTALREVVK